MDYAALARWIELSEAEGVAGAVEAERERGAPGATEALGQARLVFAGRGSPLNQTYGLGFDGPVDAAMLDRVIAFYESRGEPARILVCPLADPSLLRCARAAGFGLLHFIDTLALPLDGVALWAPQEDTDFRVRAVDIADPADVERLGRALARAFAPEGAPESDLALEKMLIRQPSALALVAERDGVVMGGGMVGLSQGRAALFAGATLPEFRRQGVQTAVMRERLRLSAQQGCTLAVVGASPGAATRRNAERLGFRLAYTRVALERVHSPSGAERFVMLALLLSACLSVPVPAVPPAPAPASVVPSPTAPVPASPVPCATEADCGWNDPCTPSACGAAHPPPPGVRCGRPNTPGRCLCATGTCTLVRQGPETAPVSCKEASDCGFDPTAGLCVAGAGPSTGVHCACDTLNNRCVRTFTGEIACQQDADCSWQSIGGSPRVAVPAWLVPRPVPAPVRPCKDSEVDSVCTERKVCELRAWKC